MLLELHSDEEPESQDQSLNQLGTMDELEEATNNLASASPDDTASNTMAASKADEVDSDAEKDQKTPENNSVPSTADDNTETMSAMFPDTQVKVHYFPPDKYQLDRLNDDQVRPFFYQICEVLLWRKPIAPVLSLLFKSVIVFLRRDRAILELVTRKVAPMSVVAKTLFALISKSVIHISCFPNSRNSPETFPT